MQSNEIRQGFERAEHCIHQAARVCSSANSISMDLKDSIQLLDYQIDRARQVVMQSSDENSVRQCIMNWNSLVIGLAMRANATRAPVRKSSKQ